MNGILVVDKPRGASSHDVVQWGRRAFGTRSVGHAGTLDPMATGVLLLLVGEATKLSAFLTLADKRYVAEVALGAETDSLDADGVVVTELPVPGSISIDSVRAALGPMLGSVEQQAPAVSAIKVQGRALHERVRRGEDVSAPVREVVLHSADVLCVEERRIELSIHCGKGYYVRSLARDLSRALGTVGHLSALRRTSSGPFVVDKAFPGERLRAIRSDAERAELRAKLVGLVDACEGMARARLTEAGAMHARHGRPVPFTDTGLECSPGPVEPVAMLSPSGQLLAIGKADATGCLRVVRGFVG
ncbi:MAG: tRNA pseudouridine(55) synthase TruB [Polyangiaceae bacterium]|nr:tRNA pseudouridine(55) synthase TruB [Polyangiaceae bacterium]